MRPKYQRNKAAMMETKKTHIHTHNNIVTKLLLKMYVHEDIIIPIFVPPETTGK